jgi:DNA-binding winged helix-turn-helix (wHTH) protein
MYPAAQNAREHTITRTVRFGPFEVSMETGELRKHGIRVRLQHRPFQILAALIESPGRLVTREELRRRLWSADVFVDFESGLNTAVNRLRLALGDSAENPVYIETLSRLGYRFLPSVEVADEQPRQVPASAEPSPEPAAVLVAPKAETAPPRLARSSRTWIPALALAGVLLAIAAGLAIRSTPHDVSFNRLTFRKGFISDARFSKSGEQIVYSAEWNGPPSRLFSLTTGGRESKDLNVSDAWLAGIPSGSQFGIFVRSPNGNSPLLETGSFAGGVRRTIAAHVRSADWGPDGSLAAITALGSEYAVEYPLGRKLYRSANWLSDLRVSPDGMRLAFCEHPVPLDDAGQVTVINSAGGEARILSRGWESMRGLAWYPSGSEIWFTAAHSGVEKSLWAVSLDGRARLLSQTPGGLELRDISRSGQVLVTRSSEHMSMLLGDLPHGSAADISWLDWSHAVAISADGNTILFDETGSGGGSAYSVFVRRRNSSSPERVGSGRAMDLSPDGRSALTGDAADPSKLSLIALENTRAARAVPSHGFVYRWSRFFPDAQQILSAGHYPGQAEGIYRQRLSEPPQVLNSALQLDDAVIDPTGRFAAGVSEACQINILDLLNGHPRAISVGKMAYPVLFVDKGHVLTRTAVNKSIALDMLDIASGQLRPFRQLEPTDSTGLAHTFPLHVARDLQSYVYSRAYLYSDLFLVSGLR